MSDPFIGEIQWVAFNFAPRGWAMCNGAILPISQYTALFSLLGTTFGGDGRTTFGLPDLMERAHVGMGTGPGLSPYAWGQRSGQAQVVLTADQMPAHDHGAQPATSEAATATSPADGIPAESGPLDAYGTGPVVTLPASVTATGGGQPIDNHQPSLTLLPVIAVTGVFPSRS